MECGCGASLLDSVSCLVWKCPAVGSERRGDTGRLERPSGQGKVYCKVKVRHYCVYVDRRNHEKR